MLLRSLPGQFGDSGLIKRTGYRDVSGLLEAAQLRTGRRSHLSVRATNTEAKFVKSGLRLNQLHRLLRCRSSRTLDGKVSSAPICSRLPAHLPVSYTPGGEMGGCVCVDIVDCLNPYICFAAPCYSIDVEREREERNPK